MCLYVSLVQFPYLCVYTFFVFHRMVFLRSGNRKLFLGKQNWTCSFNCIWYLHTHFEINFSQMLSFYPAATSDIAVAAIAAAIVASSGGVGVAVYCIRLWIICDVTEGNDALGAEASTSNSCWLSSLLPFAVAFSFFKFMEITLIFKFALIY